MQHAPHAVVLGLDSVTGLQASRLLARRGIPVVGIAEDRRHPCCFTRTAQVVRQCEMTPSGLAAALSSLSASLPSGAVLIPCTDDAVLALSRVRDRLPPSLLHALPAADLVAALLDKERFHRLASENGLPVPRTLAVTRAVDARLAARELGFPCVLKPTLKTRAWSEAAGASVSVVRDAGDLERLLVAIDGLDQPFLLQEWVPGADTDMYSRHAYVDRDGRTLLSCVARKLRQWPPGAGVTTLAVEIDAPEIEEPCARLLAGVGYSGLCELELKRDSASGRVVLIEANPARVALAMPIAEAAGVELLHTVYRYVAGLPPPEPRSERKRGAKWIWWRADRASAAHYLRRGELGVADYARSLGGHPSEAEISLHDPLPFAVLAWRTLRRVARLTPRSPSRSTARGSPATSPRAGARRLRE